MALLALQGVVEWYLFALFVKHAGPGGIFHGNGLLVIFALCLPLSIPAAIFTRRWVGLGSEATLVANAIVAGAALLCDGIGLTWGRDIIYGPDLLNVLDGAAAILWAVGVSLVGALILSRPRRLPSDAISDSRELTRTEV